MIEGLLEAILGPLLEIAFEVVSEIIFEVVLYGFLYRINFKSKRFATAIEVTGYGLIGVMLGVGSLFVIPHSFIQSANLAVVNLVLSPVAAGAAMSAIGAIRRRRGQDLISLDSFLNGAAFGFGLTVVRFLFA